MAKYFTEQDDADGQPIPGPLIEADSVEEAQSICAIKGLDYRGVVADIVDEVKWTGEDDWRNGEPIKRLETGEDFGEPVKPPRQWDGRAWVGRLCANKACRKEVERETLYSTFIMGNGEGEAEQYTLCQNCVQRIMLKTLDVDKMIPDNYDPRVPQGIVPASLTPANAVIVP